MPKLYRRKLKLPNKSRFCVYIVYVLGLCIVPFITNKNLQSLDEYYDGQLIELNSDPNDNKKPIQISGQKLMKLRTPIIVLGFLNSEKNSIHHFFQCAGLSSTYDCCRSDASDHHSCRTDDKCGNNFDPFSGNNDEISNIDKTEPFDVLYVQQSTLEEIHLQYPDCTFLLNVSETQYRERSGLKKMLAAYNEDIRSFVMQHPSHSLVEIDVTNENVGEEMHKEFGLNSSCWVRLDESPTDKENIEKNIELDDNHLSKELQNEKLEQLLAQNTSCSSSSCQEASKKNLRNEASVDQGTKPNIVSHTVLQNGQSDRLILQNILKLPKPIIVVGLPKSGTTSIYKFFQCAGISTSHYCCSPGAKDHPPCHPEDTPRAEIESHKCGVCIRRNVYFGNPPLDGCGDTYDVFAQIDAEIGRELYMPQVKALDQFHLHYPNATFVLNLRDVSSWEKSVRKWFGLAHRMQETHLPEFGYPRGKMALQEFYVNHTKRIRDFSKKYPSHTLVEVNIDDENAGEKMANAFGLESSCWNHANANKGRGH